MLVALVACASAQNVDRHEEATRYLEQAAKEHSSPLLSTLAIKMATASEGSALTKVIKFIDEAYNNIQTQIEKETKADAWCKIETEKNQAKLDRLTRYRTEAEEGQTDAASDLGDATEQIEGLEKETDEKQAERTTRTESFRDIKQEYEDEIMHSNSFIRDLNGIAQGMKEARAVSGVTDDTKDALNNAYDIFHTLATRAGEQMDEQQKDLARETKEFRDYTDADDRNIKRLASDITFQTKRKSKASTDHGEFLEDFRAKSQSLASERELRKALDAKCVKTTINHKEVAKQRQSEIDSLKQVKEILSQ